MATSTPPAVLRGEFGDNADLVGIEFRGSFIRDSQPIGPPTPGTLHVGADGLHVRCDERSWFVAYTELVGVDIDGQALRVNTSNGRGLCVNTDTNVTRVRRSIERRVTAFHRADALRQLEARHGVAGDAPTHQLFARFENPSTPFDARVDTARWISRRELDAADRTYLQRVLDDVAEPTLKNALEDALGLDRPR